MENKKASLEVIDSTSLYPKDQVIKEEYGLFPLCPAYGKDYLTKTQVEKDWKSGIDFRTVHLGYISIRNFKFFKGKIPIRFNKRTEVELFDA